MSARSSWVAAAALSLTAVLVCPVRASSAKESVVPAWKVSALLDPGSARDGFSAIPGIDPRLAMAAEQMLRTHPSISAAERTIDASRHDVAAARWLRFPSVSLQAVAGSNRTGGVLAPEVDVVQPIWSGGRIGSTIDRARATTEVAAAQLDEKALDLLISLSDSYYEIGRTARLEQLYEESLAEHQRLVQSMERRVQQEVSPQADLELARARAAQVEQDLGFAKAQHEAALRKFYQLVGDRSFALGPPPSYSPDAHHSVTEAAVARAQVCHPTVRRLEAEVKVAEADRRVARSAILPQVGLQYSYDPFRGNQVGVALRAQTNGGLSPLAATDAAASRKQASEFALSDARLEIGEQVEEDLVLNRSSKVRIGSGNLAAQSTQNVAESFLRQFVAGRRNWLDLMNSVREAVAARAQLIEIETNAMASSARIHLRACDWALPQQGRN